MKLPVKKAKPKTKTSVLCRCILCKPVAFKLLLSPLAESVHVSSKGHHPVRSPQTLVRHFRILICCLRQKLLCATPADVLQDGLSVHLPLFPQRQLGDHISKVNTIISLLRRVPLVQETSSDTYRVGLSLKSALKSV